MVFDCYCLRLSPSLEVSHCVFEDGAHVSHATVADFNIVFVSDFMKLVVGWKVLGEQAKELPADVSLHVFAVWRIEPNYVSLSASGFLGVVGFISDFICGVTTLVHCIHIIGCSFRELILITRET